MRKDSQTQQIREYMEVHGSITPKEAYILCGCMRLAARAFEQNWPSELEYRGKKRFSRYYLT